RGNLLSKAHLKSIYFEGVFWGEDTNKTAQLEKQYESLIEDGVKLNTKYLLSTEEKSAEIKVKLKEIEEKLSDLKAKIKEIPPVELPIWSERLRNDAPILIAESDAFFQFNRFIRVFQAMKWARDFGGAPDPQVARVR